MFAQVALPDGRASDTLGHPNGLISGHLAVNVFPQKTHSIVLKKKIATRY